VVWKASGRPSVRQQRSRWVVRVDGVDTETGRHRPRQLGTYASRRSAQRAATEFAAAGAIGGDRGTVGHLVEQWVASRTHVIWNCAERQFWLLTSFYPRPVVVDPRSQIQAELDQELAPLKQRLAETEGWWEKRRVKRQMSKLKRRARRRLRTAVW
jgi:hypothetical protein